ncbi:unnamed protein product [Pedinophyceae sp. YPF-701]|nr:unnamed protein product [Pedinophyceae sp. YPF-701]
MGGSPGRQKLFQLAKGFRGRAKNCYRIAKQAVYKALQKSWTDGRNRKREARELWIQKINAGTRQHGLPYSQFIHGLKEDNIALDRKSLATLAEYEPLSFQTLVERVKYMKGITPETLAQMPAKRARPQVGRKPVPHQPPPL